MKNLKRLGALVSALFTWKMCFAVPILGILAYVCTLFIPSAIGTGAIVGGAYVVSEKRKNEMLEKEKELEREKIIAIEKEKRTHWDNANYLNSSEFFPMCKELGSTSNDIARIKNYAKFLESAIENYFNVVVAGKILTLTCHIEYLSRVLAQKSAITNENYAEAFKELLSLIYIAESLQNAANYLAVFEKKESVYFYTDAMNTNLRNLRVTLSHAINQTSPNAATFEKVFNNDVAAFESLKRDFPDKLKYFDANLVNYTEELKEFVFQYADKRAKEAVLNELKDKYEESKILESFYQVRAFVKLEATFYISSNVLLDYRNGEMEGLIKFIKLKYIEKII